MMNTKLFTPADLTDPAEQSSRGWRLLGLLLVILSAVTFYGGIFFLVKAVLRWVVCRG